jgi:hypothetical protein
VRFPLSCQRRPLTGSVARPRPRPEGRRRPQGRPYTGRAALPTPEEPAAFVECDGGKDEFVRIDTYDWRHGTHSFQGCLGTQAYLGRGGDADASLKP